MHTNVENPTAPSSESMAEFTDSRQFKRNLAVSRYRNNTHWLPNYSWKPLEKFDGPRKKPIWESKQEVVTEEDKKKRALFDEWDRKMRQVTREQRKKWKSWSNDENILSDKMSTSSNEDLEHTTKATEPRISVTDQLVDSSIEVQNTLHNGQWRTVVTNTSRDPMKANRIRDNSKKPIDQSIFPKGRWGMSISEPPEEFLNAIDQRSNIQRSNRAPEQEQLESSNKSFNNKGKTTTEPSVVVTFPPGRWGIGVKEPPPEFLKEINKKLLTLKINSQAEEESKNEVPRKDTKVYDSQHQQGQRRSMHTKAKSMESSNDQWSSSESSSRREFQGGIQAHGHPEMVVSQRAKNPHQLDMGTMQDPPFQQLTPIQNLLLYKMLFSPQLARTIDVPMIPELRENRIVFDRLRNKIAPSMRCIICQT